MLFRFFQRTAIAATILFLAAAPLAAQMNIPVPNGSFESTAEGPDGGTLLAVGGIWPEADDVPNTPNFWLEPGPVGGDLNAFPEELVPPQLSGEDLSNLTLDTGVFFNPPVVFDGENFVPNDNFVEGADGDVVAFLFGSSELDPSIGFFQTLTKTYQPEYSYTLSVSVGKSAILPPSPADSATLSIALFYEDGGTRQIIEETLVAVDDVNANMVAPLTVELGEVDAADAWANQEIGIAIAPDSGVSGAWILDDVRLTQIPEPAGLSILAFGAAAGLLRRRNR